MTALNDFGGVLGRPLENFFWALLIHGHGSWLVCEVALMCGWEETIVHIYERTSH